MRFLSIVLLFLALILETSLTTLPLVFITSLILMVVFRQSWVFAFAFIFGLFLDLMSFNSVGISSAYLVIFLFLVLLYQRKFEIATYYFVLGAALSGSLGYMILRRYADHLFLQGILSAIIGLVLFIFLTRVSYKFSNSKT